LPRWGRESPRTIGDSQLPDLGLEVFHLLLINFQRLPTAALKYARRAFKQCPLPLMDHRRMDAEPTGQFAHPSAPLTPPWP
jgi:hypothetical protein